MNPAVAREQLSGSGRRHAHAPARRVRISESLKKRLRRTPRREVQTVVLRKSLRSREHNPRQKPMEGDRLCQSRLLRSNCTVHGSDFLGGQMPRGLVHAIDRYY